MNSVVANAANMPTLANTNLSLYNGNIRQMRTSFHANLTTAATANTTGTFFAADNGVFRYTYDQLNRLKTQQLWASATTTPALPSDRFAMKLAYDANGNIIELTRKGEATSTTNSTPRDMDNLVYNYNTASGFLTNNRLNYVKDVVANSPYTDDIESQDVNNYQYDAIGNLIYDASENTKMRWNIGGKLFKVEKEGKIINYEYDATGNRILKEVIALSGGAGTTRTYYTRDAQGNTLATYTSTITPQNRTA